MEEINITCKTILVQKYSIVALIALNLIIRTMVAHVYKRKVGTFCMHVREYEITWKLELTSIKSSKPAQGIPGDVGGRGELAK